MKDLIKGVKFTILISLKRGKRTRRIWAATSFPILLVSPCERWCARQHTWKVYKNIFDIIEIINDEEFQIKREWFRFFSAGINQFQFSRFGFALTCDEEKTSMKFSSSLLGKFNASRWRSEKVLKLMSNNEALKIGMNSCFEI